MRNHQAQSRITALLLAGIMLLSAWAMPVYAEGGPDEPPVTAQDAETDDPEQQNSEKTEGFPSVVDGEPVNNIDPVEPDDPADHEEEDNPANDPSGTKPDENGPPDHEVGDNPPAAAPPTLNDSSIVAFAPLDGDVAQQKVRTGTLLADLTLPDTLAATVEDGDGQQTGADVTVKHWRAAPDYDPQAVVSYTFTPELERYALADGVALPEITVGVFAGIMPTADTYTISSYGELATRLANYATAMDDVEITLAADFPTDTMTAAFTVPGNSGGYTLTIKSANPADPAEIIRDASITIHLFTVNSGAHLILQHVVLDGDNVSAKGTLVRVQGGGAFTMKAGAVLQNNVTSHFGGGVYVLNDGTFVMENGQITDNTAYHGGGVYVGPSSSFTMKSGIISGNTTDYHGGGVFASSNSIFLMENGQISDNTAGYHGGGVFTTSNSTFLMEDGQISGNTATFTCGGAYVAGDFTMTDGQIINNKGIVNSGGVWIADDGSFTMEGGRIAGNNAPNGGGVYINNKNTFTMKGGEISGNTADRFGGGVYISGNTTRNGTIKLSGKPIFDGNGIYAGVAFGTAIKITGDLSDGAKVLIEGSGQSGQMTVGRSVAQKISGNPLKPGEAAVFQSIDGSNLIGGVVGNYVVWRVYHNVIINPAANGTVSADKSVAIMGEIVTLTITPDSGYGLSRLDTTPGTLSITGSGNTYTFTMPASSVTLTPVFAKFFTVTYNANGGTGGYSVPNIAAGATHTVVTDSETGITYTGLLFLYWNTQPDGSGDSYDPGDIITITDNLTLYAIWEPVITINVHPANTSVTEGSISGSLSVAASVTPPGTALNYQWYSNTTASNTGGTAISGATSATFPIPTGLTTGTHYYYCVVSATDAVSVSTNVAAVTVDKQTHAQTPGISAHPQGGTYKRGATAAALTVTASVSDGGTLSYQWYRSASNTGGTAISGATGTSYTPSTGTTGTTYYYVVVTNTNSSVNGSKTATITSNTAAVTVESSGNGGGGNGGGSTTYTVSYNANGGTGRAPGDASMTAGSSYTIASPANLTAPDGQRFKEWNTNSTGSGTGYQPGDKITMPSRNLTLSAIWEDIPASGIYTVTFHPSGGSVSPSSMQTGADGKLASLPTPTRSGYAFVGWYTAQSGGTQITTSYVFTGNTTVYAHWTADSLGGGSSGRNSAGITIKCVDESGNTITTRNTSGTIGAKISINAPTIDSYKLLDDSPLTCTVKASGNTVTFRYEKITGEPEPETPEETETIHHPAYISGYPDGSFRPDSPMNRGEAAVMLYGLMDSEISATSYVPSFTDVEPGAWYYEAVMELARRGIISGYPDGSFSPANTITRAEFVTLALKFAGIEPKNSEGQNNRTAFSDVDSGYWAAETIRAAVEQGFLSGYPDGTFKPENPITRVEVVSVLNAVTGRTDCNITNGKTFTDLEKNHWAYEMITNAATEHEHK